LFQIMYIYIKYMRARLSVLWRQKEARRIVDTAREMRRGG